MLILDLVFGFLLVFAGRELFWLCVGIVGFLIGVQSAEMLGYSNGWMEMLIAFAMGGAGVILAVSFEWLMVMFGVGFLGGGYLLTDLFPAAVQEDGYSWLIFVLGGIMGACLVAITFDWALILISSLLGAALIAHAVYGPPQMRDFLFIGSMVIGIVVQYLSLRGKDGHEHSVRRA